MSDKFWTIVGFSAIVFCDLYGLAALKIVGLGKDSYRNGRNTASLHF